MRKPRLAPRYHTGRRISHYHTSYAYLAGLVVVCGVMLAGVTNSTLAGTRTSSGNITVTGIVPAAPPTRAPEILDPQTGQQFSTIPIGVSGNCQAGLLVKLYRNQIFTGSVVCSASGQFSLKTDLAQGRNALTARQFDNLGQSSPESNTVAVTYQPLVASTAPANVPQLQLLPESVAVGTYPEQSLKLLPQLVGGRGPYAISVDWGDGSTDVLSQPSAGEVSLHHTYRNAGNYQVVIKASDSSGQQAYAQVAVTVNGPVGSSGIHFFSDDGRLLILWPLFIMLALILISFWLGERVEEHKLRQDFKQA